MSHRRQTGGTLALVAASLIIIIMVAVGLFFLSQLLGGGLEAQHATDAGNLNVAKNALHSPSISPKGAESDEFGGLFTNGKIDLENYNKLAGKALIVAMNAAAEGTSSAADHAKSELNMVEGSGGIGERLCTALQDGSSKKGFFDAVSAANSLRMLNWNGASANSDASFDAVSFMRKNAKAPANVYLRQSQFPGVPDQASFVSRNFQASEGKDADKKLFPFGYTPISIAGLNVYAVPVRPGEQPHLVNQEEFENEKTSPLTSGSKSLLPPNAFMSNSAAHEMHGFGVKMRSSAIVGTLAPSAAASIPHGYIVIDNTGAESGELKAHDSDIFADAVMDGVDVFGGYITQDHSAFENIKNYAGDDVPLSLAQNIKPPITRPDELRRLRERLRQGPAPTQCNSGTVFTSDCDQNTLNTIKQYMPPSVSDPQPAMMSSELMAIESLKWQVLSKRLEPPFIWGRIDRQPKPTGLKAWDHRALLWPFPLIGHTGTLGQLLEQAGGGDFKKDILIRMHQINPEAKDYESVFNQRVPMGKVSYLYCENNEFKISQHNPYPMPDLNIPSLNLPDGKVVSKQSPLVWPLEGRFLNVIGDFGATHPWDCPAIHFAANPEYMGGFSYDKVQWTPSTGYLNLLGVIKFQNYAERKTDTPYTCPC